MGIKTTVAISDSSIEWARARFDEVSWSPTINGALADFGYLLRESLPALTPDEWLPILNAYNGHFFDRTLERSAGISIASCIMDDQGALNINELPVEYQEPVKRIATLSKAEQFAVLDVVRRYWIAAGKKELRGDTLADQIKHLIG